MESVEFYIKKRKKENSRGLVILLISVVMLAMAALMLIIINGVPASYSPALSSLAHIFIIAFLVCLYVGLVYLTAPFIFYRKYHGNYIIFYSSAGGKRALSINDEVATVGGLSQRDYYGQLPDGTEVHAQIGVFTHNVKFSIGSSNNHNISFM